MNIYNFYIIFYVVDYADFLHNFQYFTHTKGEGA